MLVLFVNDPSPSLPIKGRVLAGALDEIVQHTRCDTLPFMGRDGEGKDEHV
jgi:hypothetical protein